MARPDLDGLVFRVNWINSDPHALYYAVGGLFRPLVGTVWPRLLPEGMKLWEIDAHADMGIETGSNIHHWSLVRAMDKSGKIYVTFYQEDGGAGEPDRYISNGLTFDRYSFKREQIHDGALRKAGDPLLWEPKHDGNIFATDTGYYLMDRGQRRHIANPAVCMDIFGPLTPIAYPEGNLIPQGPEIDGDSRLVAVPGQPEIWLVEKPKSLPQHAHPSAVPYFGTRRHIADPNTLDYYHFWGTVHPISADDLLQYQILGPISWPGRSPAEAS